MINFQEPWFKIEAGNEAIGIKEEIKRELPEEHILNTFEDFRVIARRHDQDDILLEIINEAEISHALIHLIWSGKPEPVESLPLTIFKTEGELQRFIDTEALAKQTQ